MNLQTPRNSCLYKFVTSTFRNSSTQLFKNTSRACGTNLQNPDKTMCRIHIPDNGYRFVQSDQRGAEAYRVASLCAPGFYRELFDYGVKPHSYICLYVFAEQLTKEFKLPIREFQLPPSQLIKHPEWKRLGVLIQDTDLWPASRRYYFIGKMIEHSGNYDIRVNGFIMNVLEKSQGMVALSKRDGEMFLDIRKNLFPEIANWRAWVPQELIRTQKIYGFGELRNAFGYPRRFNSLWFDESNLKEAYAFDPQSTIGCITNIAFCLMQEYIEDNKLDWAMLNNKHDSMLTQVPDSDEEDKHCRQKQQEFLGQLFYGRLDNKEFKMKSESQSGYNWASANAKNPKGLGSITL